MSRFVDALFCYADEETVVSLRAFDQFDRTKPPFAIHAVKLNGPDSRKRLIEEACRVAQCSANNASPIVFAPPIATFTNAQRTRGADLANGLVLSVEVDDVDPDRTRARLESILGPATAVVASGSDWTDPATGEIKPKIHMHWRLNEPTRVSEDHAKLQQARDLATTLVGGDPTGKPIVHPLRWPGSWNTKKEPHLARLLALNPDVEIDLGEALDALQDASGQPLAPEFKAALPVKPLPPEQLKVLASAFAAIPNEDAHYDTWIRLGYAAHRATGGSDQGFELWKEWSKKSAKYNAVEQEAAWTRICAAIDGASAPRQISAGTVFWMAREAGWKRPLPEPPVYLEEPPPHPGPDYIAGADERATGTNADGAGADSGAGPGGADGYAGADAALTTDVAAGPDPVSKLVTEFNRRYIVVNEAGKTVIYAPTHDPILNRQYYQRSTFADLSRLHMNRLVQLAVRKNGAPIVKPAADVWLRHPKRRQFIRGVTFDPSGRRTPAHMLNLWEGFAVKPKAGSWAGMQDHIINVICRGNGQHRDYLMGWMARLVQHPAEQGEVAVILCGGEGTGKGTLARALLHIVGQHGLAISNPKHLTGNFNAHLRDCIFLFADECFIAGDRTHVRVLKSIITEPYLTICRWRLKSA
jgi:hypothetical protein